MYYDQIKLLKQGVEKARGLLGDAIDVVPGLGTVNQGLLAAENIGRGNLSGAAENIQNLVPAGKIAGRAIRALTKGRSAGETGGLLGATKYETDADRRMAIAQRNAALPVEQGGLGLPADNTPQMRAKAMGYTEEAFIGRDGDYEAYDVTKAVGKTAGTGAWSSSNPAVASTYALGKEANVMPVLVRQGNSLSVDAKGKNWNRLDAKTKVKAPAMVVEDKDAAKLPQLNLLEDAPPLKRVKAINSSLGKMFPDDVKYDDFSTDDLARFGRNQQYDSARFDNVVDVGASGRYMTDQAKNPSTNFVSYNPADLRSRFAAFDPMRRGEADLLALQGGQYTPQDLLGFERMLGLLGE